MEKQEGEVRTIAGEQAATAPVREFSEGRASGSGLVRVFMNGAGLRAGWRAVLYLLLFAVCLTVLFLPVTLLTHGRHTRGEMPPLLALSGEGLQAAAIFGAAALLARIERRPLLALPFQGQARTARFFSGVVWGFVALSALVFALWKSHLLAFGPVSLHAGPAITYGLVWAVSFLLVGISEEALMRGYLQSILARGLGFWPAALLISALFGAMHLSNRGESQIGILSAALAGLLFCLSLWYTGSLWWAIGFHAAWDWSQSFFYGTADSGLLVRGHFLAEHPVGNAFWSGGATGPEGSPYVVVLLCLAAAGCWAWWGRRTPAWPQLHQADPEPERATPFPSTTLERA